MLAASFEQRLKANVRILMLQGLDEQEATAEAYRSLGREPPAVPRPPQDLEEEIEELRFQLACERKRADATSARARILLRQNRVLLGKRLVHA